jgi:16S rRNA C967 or C1407 C5-methylase (RsmB/RsmF family)
VLKDDGVLVYATCSLLEEEGENQARRLLTLTCAPSSINGATGAEPYLNSKQRRAQRRAEARRQAGTSDQKGIANFEPRTSVPIDTVGDIAPQQLSTAAAAAVPSSALLETFPIAAWEVPGFEQAITPEGWLRVLPGCLPPPLNAVDGFFVARFRKKNCSKIPVEAGK